jgi:hypothetical protein
MFSIFDKGNRTMKKDADKNELSLEALLFRIIVFIAVVVGIVQFFNILYSGVHDVAKPINADNATEPTPAATDSLHKTERFIRPNVPLVMPDTVYQHKDLKEKEMIKPDKGVK